MAYSSHDKQHTIRTNRKHQDLGSQGRGSILGNRNRSERKEVSTGIQQVDHGTGNQSVVWSEVVGKRW